MEQTLALLFFLFKSQCVEICFINYIYLPKVLSFLQSYKWKNLSFFYQRFDCKTQ